MSIRPAAVRAKDLVLAYGSTVALSASTFEIPKGTITAVIGPNGSGKSTLLGAIAGLVKPAGGEIDVETTGPSSISFVLQTTKVHDVLPISVEEVVAMSRYANRGLHRRLQDEDREAIREAMERMDIANIASKHLSRLSGGQRQRAFVAQGLAQDHDLLLLDEPLTGIDLTTALAIDKVIHDEISEGCTVIMTTHDLSEARVAEHVLLLSGAVVASGPPQEVLTTQNLTDAYGSTLLHVEGDLIVIDDAAHQPVDGRHVHRERTIHTESSPLDRHHD